MSRRDTILIAVLVNAGLLVVLFATALPSKHAQPVTNEPIAQVKTIEVAPTIQAPVHAALPTDEVDQVLKQYAPQVSEETSLASSQAMDAMSQAKEPDLAATFTQPTLVDTPSSSNYVEVKVKKGDVLDKIARTHRCGVDEIMRINNLSSTRLHIGQVLKVPTKSSVSVKKESSIAKKEDVVQGPVSSTGVKYYTVKVGDNPWTIAVKNHMKVEELLKLNNLNDEKARRLKPGDQIRIK